VQGLLDGLKLGSFPALTPLPFLMDEPTITPEKRISMPCSSCGGQMEFSEAKGELECPFCGATKALPNEQDLIVENDFREALNLNLHTTQGLGLERKQIACRTCGANTTIPPEQVTVQCDFCGSREINEEAYDAKTIQPQGVLPFKLEQKKAEEIFRDWIGKGWFYASGLKKVQQLHDIRGVYVPFWTYDAHTASNWTAEAGYYYYVTETYTDSNGKRQTRQVRKTRWVPASGYYENFFDDVLVIASQGVTQKRAERIYPFTLTEIVNYESEYLLGKHAEVYALDVQKGYDVADGIMDQYIYSECAKRIPGDTHRNLRVRTRKDGITYKHILLPLWIAAYQFKEKSFQVVVNGETGKISGEKPLSWLKITLAILLVIAVAVGVYFLGLEMGWWNGASSRNGPNVPVGG